MTPPKVGMILRSQNTNATAEVIAIQPDGRPIIMRPNPSSPTEFYSHDIPRNYPGWDVIYNKRKESHDVDCLVCDRDGRCSCSSV